MEKMEINLKGAETFLGIFIFTTEELICESRYSNLSRKIPVDVMSMIILSERKI